MEGRKMSKALFPPITAGVEWSTRTLIYRFELGLYLTVQARDMYYTVVV